MRAQKMTGTDLLNNEIARLRAKCKELQATEEFGYFKPGAFGWTDCKKYEDGAVALYERPAMRPLTNNQIRELLLAHGYQIKSDATDLAPYIYIAARAIERAHGIG